VTLDGTPSSLGYKREVPVDGLMGTVAQKLKQFADIIYRF